MDMEGLTEEVFRELHSPQLRGIGFPDALVATLYSKLTTGSRDRAVDELTRCFESSHPGSRDPSSTFMLRSKVSMVPASDVFIVPHAWESDGGRQGRRELLTNPQLLATVERLLGIERDELTGAHDFEKIDKEMIEQVRTHSEKSRLVAQEALLNTGYDVIAAIVAAEDIREANSRRKEKTSMPAISFEEFKKGLASMASSSAPVPDDDVRYLYEDYLRKKASDPDPVRDDSGWVHCGSYSWTDTSEEDEEAVAVTVPLPAGTRKRDVTSKLAVHHWKVEVCDRTGNKKTIVDRDLSAPVIPDESFWTLDGNGMNMSLQKARPGEKWSSLFVGEVQLSRTEMEKVAAFAQRRRRARVQRVLDKMWLLNQTYQAVTPEGRQKPVWYLMDRHGLALTHSDQPNFLCKPFANAVTGKVMSLMWPVREVGVGERCTRDFVPLLRPDDSPEQRGARKIAILNTDPLRKTLGSIPRAHEVTPVGVGARWKHSLKKFQVPDRSQSLKVFLYEKDDNSKDWTLDGIEGYTLVDSADSADIVLGDIPPVLYETIQSSNRLLARLPGDECLVNKAELCMLTRGRERECFAQGVDLTREAAELLRQCEEESLVESWRAVLPMRRGVPVQPRVTRNVVEMVRCVENGPCVASKFCLLTVLHEGRRCCLQYPVVVRPPDVFLHSTSPRVRVAEKESKDGFDPWDTDGLFTCSYLTVQWADFLGQFTTKYKASWTRVQEQVNTAVRELFSLALPTCASEGAAVYTIDVLIRVPSLTPLVIGVDPLPAFPSAHVARQCLDMLVGRSDCREGVVHLLPD